MVRQGEAGDENNKIEKDTREEFLSSCFSLLTFHFLLKIRAFERVLAHIQDLIRLCEESWRIHEGWSPL